MFISPSDLIVAAFKAFRAGSLHLHDLRTINQCVGRVTNAVEAGSARSIADQAPDAANSRAK